MTVMTRDVTGLAGVATVDITPDFPVELVGGYRENPVTMQVLHPLSGQVLVLERSGTRRCLVSVDSLGLTIALTNSLRHAIASELRICSAEVMVSYTHTHSAPTPLAATGGSRYLRLLTERLTVAARSTAKHLRPCLIAWALGKAGLADNRRAGCDVVDDRLGVLLVADAHDRAPIALVVRASAHANVLMTSTAISSDYVGLARAEIEDDYGCPVLFVQGASGNLKPSGVDAVRGGDLADAETAGHRLAEGVRALRPQLQSWLRPLDELGSGSRPIEMVADVPTADEARRIAGEAREQAGINGSGWLAECARLRDAGIAVQVKVREIHVLRVNEGCLLGMPDELFCELALEAAGRSGNYLLFLNGYTNGCTGYLATRDEWERGGYEPVYSYLVFYPFHDQVASFRPDSAGRIVECVVDLWREVMGG